MYKITNKSSQPVSLVNNWLGTFLHDQHLHPACNGHLEQETLKTSEISYSINCEFCFQNSSSSYHIVGNSQHIWDILFNLSITVTKYLGDPLSQLFFLIQLCYSRLVPVAIVVFRYLMVCQALRCQNLGGERPLWHIVSWWWQVWCLWGWQLWLWCSWWC